MSHPPPLSLDARAALTFRHECWRAVCLGVLESSTITFFLIVLNRWFASGALSKALVSSGSSLGMLAGLLVVSFVTARRWRVADAASCLSAVGCLAMLMAILAPNTGIFVLGAVLMNVAQASQLPLRTQIYHSNFPVAERGSLYARVVMVRIVSVAAFSQLGGWLLTRDLGWYRALLGGGALALIIMAIIWRRTPSEPLPASAETHPLRALRHLRGDRLFAISLVSWTIMGFANLTMLPLRVEYLVNPRFGIALPPDQIALLTGVLPNVARLLLIPIWGRLFDNAGIYTMRFAIHGSVIFAIGSFFSAETQLGLTLGAICFGISTAGADVLWPLWVTKVAPPAAVAEYAAVHAFFTGLRGIAAPLFAFHALDHLPLGALRNVSLFMVVLATLLLWPEKLAARRHKFNPS